MQGRQKKAVLVLSGIVAVVWLLSTLSRGREPMYQGKTVRRWIEELPPGHPFFLGTGINRDTPAKQALRSIGTDAVPYLARAMNRRDSIMVDLSLKLWYRWPWLQRHLTRPVPRIELRREAARALQEIVSTHPKASFGNIVSALARTMRDPDSNLWMTAMATVGMIAVREHNQEACRALIAALDSPDDGVRSHAAWKLSDGDQTLSVALPALRRRLSDRSDAVRINAALAVYRIGHQTNEAVAVLISALAAKTPTDRGNAAFQLSLIGPAAKAAIPALEQTVKDPDLYVQNQATAALNKIHPGRHKEEKPNWQALVEQLKSPDQNTRCSAAFGLKEIAAEALPAIPALVEALRTRSVDNLWAVGQALWTIDPQQAAVIVPAMDNHLADPNAANRHMAALVLAKIGSEARQTLPTLHSGMTDSSLWVRQYCAYAWLRVGGQGEATRRQAVEILVDCLQAKCHIQDRKNSARFLGEAGSIAKEAVPALRDVARHGDDEELAKLAAEALSKIGSAAPDGAAKPE